jgi:hypothetical protein
VGYVFEDCPVKDIVILESLPDEKIPKQLSQVRVIRLIIKPQTPRIIQENGKLVGKPTTKHLGRSRHLLLHNPIILLLLGRSLEALPGERSTTKVHKDVAQALEVVTTGLFDAEVGVDGGVAGGAGEIFVFAVGDVEVGFGVAVFFGETKVDYVDLVATFANAHEKVVGFDVPVDE